YRHEDLNAELTVAPDGTVSLPLLGRVQIADRTYAELVTILEDGWGQYYTDVSVAVNVTEVNNQKIFVVGEVENPTVMQITGELTILEALVRAGGINPDARTKNLLLIRGGDDEGALYAVDVDALLRGDMTQNVALQKGDVVVVPARTIVNVERFFRHVQGILSPFVNISQLYRNVSLPGNSVLLEDAPSADE
ncbi:MAG: polysaccharide export protein, partial [Proteobacteria bacterium]|nr:polysaccharide export protein [Pseudomonadota bacterium]